MEIWFVTAGLMGAVALVMGVGVIFGRKPLKGSCGGVGGSCHCINGGSCPNKKLSGAHPE